MQKRVVVALAVLMGALVLSTAYVVAQDEKVRLTLSEPKGEIGAREIFGVKKGISVHLANEALEQRGWEFVRFETNSECQGIHYGANTVVATFREGGWTRGVACVASTGDTVQNFTWWFFPGTP
jgi:hypothetical protein